VVVAVPGELLVVLAAEELLVWKAIVPLGKGWLAVEKTRLADEKRPMQLNLSETEIAVSQVDCL
jgi:hypothetical protein